MLRLPISPDARSGGQRYGLTKEVKTGAILALPSRVRYR
jgi:hypothetical protein